MGCRAISSHPPRIASTNPPEGPSSSSVVVRPGHSSPITTWILEQPHAFRDEDRPVRAALAVAAHDARPPRAPPRRLELHDRPALGPGDAARCRLCPAGYSGADQHGLCLVTLPEFVPDAGIELASLRGRPVIIEEDGDKIGLA
jgi:hypothetical protein